MVYLRILVRLTSVYVVLGSAIPSDLRGIVSAIASVIEIIVKVRLQ
ncbi:hypothetical protein [Chroococcidiopsis sp. CCMEE 29]|nr:hypothetical protein [Chroococcidiopsis sp. CCMEE 29]